MENDQGYRYYYVDNTKPTPFTLSEHSLDPMAIINKDSDKNKNKEKEIEEDQDIDMDPNDKNKNKEIEEDQDIDVDSTTGTDPENTKSAVQLTLESAIYNREKEDIAFYVMYSDSPGKKDTQKPINRYQKTTEGTTSYGHAKGVVAFGEDTGLWLVHTAPKFPDYDMYRWPDNAREKGQIFLCVTLKTDNAALVVKHLVMRQVYAYDVHSNTESLFKIWQAYKGNLMAIIDKKNTLAESMFIYNKYPFGTAGLYWHEIESKGEGKGKGKGKKTPLYIFSKNSAAGSNFYLWLAEGLGIPRLYVQTYRTGSGGRMDSFCKTKRICVMNINKLQFQDSYTSSFKSTQDHSKWAIGAWMSDEQNNEREQQNVVCIADTNRQV